ncbi:hypothetical protein J2805_002174 [Arthrobacter oryzae]|nr:hypothetical protein [Arthrobacter oryzae]
MTRFTAFQTRYHEHIEADIRLSPDARRIAYALTCYTGPGTLARCSWLQLRKATGLGHDRTGRAMHQLIDRGYARRRQTTDVTRAGWPLTLPR